MLSGDLETPLPSLKQSTAQVGITCHSTRLTRDPLIRSHGSTELCPFRMTPGTSILRGWSGRFVSADWLRYSSSMPVVSDGRAKSVQNRGPTRSLQIRSK